MRRYLTEPETPIAEKPFARGQRRRYLGRRFFAAAGGARRAIDVWESACACGSAFRVCAYLESRDPRPGPRAMPRLPLGGEAHGQTGGEECRKVDCGNASLKLAREPARGRGA